MNTPIMRQIMQAIEYNLALRSRSYALEHGIAKLRLGFVEVVLGLCRDCEEGFEGMSLQCKDGTGFGSGDMMSSMTLVHELTDGPIITNL